VLLDPCRPVNDNVCQFPALHIERCQHVFETGTDRTGEDAEAKSCAKRP